MSSAGMLAPARALGGMLLRTVHVLLTAVVGAGAVGVALCVLVTLLPIAVTFGMGVLLFNAYIYIIGD